MGNFSPHAPDVLGIEWAGLYPLELPLSQGVERGQTLVSTVAESIVGVGFPVTDETSGLYRFFPLATVYLKGHETAVGGIITDRIPVLSGSLGGGAALVDASSVQDALNTAGDTQRIDFPNLGASCEIAFATEGLFTGRRILRLTLEYVALVLTDPSFSLTLDIVRSSDSIDQRYGDLPSGGREIQTVSLGEINPVSTGVDITTETDRYPWSPIEVQGLSTAAVPESFRLAIHNRTDRYFNLFYAQLAVTHCVENRVASGARVYSFFNPSIPNEDVIGTRVPDGSSLSWSKNAGEEYVVTITAADTGGPFVDPVSSSNIESYGPTCLIPTLDGFDVFAPHEGRQAPRGRFNELVAAEADSRVTPVILFDLTVTASVDSMPYKDQRNSPIYIGAEAQQGIVQSAIAADTPYPFMRFYARRIGDPAGALFLTDSATGATGGSITRSEFDLLHDLTEPVDRRSSGWRLVELHGTPAIRFDNSGTIKKVRFSASDGDTANFWQVLGEEHFVGDATYGGPTAHTEDSVNIGGDAGIHSFADLVVSFGTDPPAVGGFALDIGFFNISLGQDCGIQAPGEYPVIAYAALRWGASTIANFSYYEVQRSDSFDPVFRTIAKIHDPASVSFFDFEWRVQITSTYRIRQCRTDGFCGPWSLEVSLDNTPSLADHQFEFGPGTLIFTTNVMPQMSLALQAAYDDWVDPYTFVEAETMQMERFFGRDYQAGFKPTERGGVRFTRTVLLDPSTIVDHVTGDAAFERLRDLAWADVPYLCVKDDLGDRWLATVRVPEGNLRRRPQAFASGTVRPPIALAQVEVIEATREPFAAEFNVFGPLPPQTPDVEVQPTHGAAT